jgi:hypothetical protein
MFFLKSHFFSGFVSGNFLRARFHSIGRVSRSRELLACIFPPFRADFAFARTSRVHTYTLLGGFCVRENFSPALLHPFGRVSRLQELLAYTFSPFLASIEYSRISFVHVFSLFSVFWHATYTILFLLNPHPPKKNNSPQKQGFWGSLNLFILNHNISRMYRSMYTNH